MTDSNVPGPFGPSDAGAALGRPGVPVPARPKVLPGAGLWSGFWPGLGFASRVDLLVWGVILAFLGVALLGVVLRPLTAVDETRYLAVAWEMWQSGHYLVPTKNYEIYTHKPPLLFWTINLLWAVTGVSEFAARAVGPAFAALTLYLTGVLARRLWPQDAGVRRRATLALAAMAVFAIYGGLTMFDAMLAAVTLGGMLALLRAVETGAARWWAALGGAIALGVLAKGPVILLHLGPALLLAQLWAGRGAAMRGRDLARGAGLALATGLGLVALWLIPAILTGGTEYRDAILWTQSAGRISGSLAHARPWWFFLALLPVLLFPLVALPQLWRAALRADWHDAGLRLCAIWALGALVLFSIVSGKQVHYLIPELPAVALIAARLLGQPAIKPRLRLLWAVLPLAALAFAGILIAAGLIGLDQATARLLRPAPMVLAWGLVLLAVCWGAMRTGGLRGAAVLSLGTVLSLNLLIGFTDTRAIYDSGRIARMIAPYQDAGIAFAGRGYSAEFNFAGRLSRPVALPHSPAALRAWALAHPGGVIVGRPDEVALNWQPVRTVLFRNAPYAVWRVADGASALPVGPDTPRTAPDAPQIAASTAARQ